jgi:hypothetical protein
MALQQEQLANQLRIMGVNGRKQGGKRVKARLFFGVPAQVE